jgi:hypothetical protein
MKPICATVEQPSCRFTSVCTSIQAWPTSALIPPTPATTSMTLASANNTGANRAIRMPPALTSPACMKADTGVGAVIEERSHR